MLSKHEMNTYGGPHWGNNMDKIVRVPGAWGSHDYKEPTLLVRGYIIEVREDFSPGDEVFPISLGPFNGFRCDGQLQDEYIVEADDVKHVLLIKRKKKLKENWREVEFNA
jgi:hypothetical protein